MQTVLLVIHVLLAVALIGVVLLQRSEGGALGIGGSGANFMSGRGAANLLTRATAILAAAFMATSITLAILATAGTKPKSIIDTAPARPAADSPERPAEPAVPLAR
ncbi:MAG: preprotein translocase subunit SecG [Alphaproteobacteria bacterium]|nr:preprotein translocase subunit SecG [Alphaproteobacteria bacterium]